MLLSPLLFARNGLLLLLQLLLMLLLLMFAVVASAAADNASVRVELLTVTSSNRETKINGEIQKERDER